ncbi:MAG: alpha/beta fold hydrolase [Spirochaetaceae bacterium]|nr:alpha/beta fold hydrolase [Spirochaetaceae bacterium]
MSNEIVELCSDYSRINRNEEFGKVIFKFYNEKDPIRLVATPWEMVHKTPVPIAVLCCHGYTGTPGELAVIGLKLYNAGFDVFTPRLPGHGSSQKEFLKSGPNNWIDCEFAAARYLKDRYDQLYVVGHSMGGLNAIIIAEALQLSKIALIAPATDLLGLEAKTTFLKLQVASFFHKKIKTPWKSNPEFFGICEREDGDDEYLGSQLWSYILPSSVIKLNKIRKIANKCLFSVGANTLLILGTKDTSVSQNSIERFKRDLLGDLKVLSIKDAGHLVLYSNNKKDSELCNNSIVEHFLEK